MEKSKPKVIDRTNKVIGPYAFDEYMDAVKSFHGHTAPGLLVGGFMVDLALKTFQKVNFLMLFVKPGHACLMPCKC